MLECLVLGDSIAQGVSTYLPECQKQVKVEHLNYLKQ